MRPLTERKQILVADDEPNLRRVLSAQLHRDGYEVIAVEDGQAALEALTLHHVDVVITDLRMPRIDGMELLRHVTETYPDVPVIMITAHGTVDTAVEALKRGAFDYITKPFEQSEFRNVVGKAARTRELSERDVAAEPSQPGRYRLIGQSGPMNEVYQVIERVADTPSTVLITGESGTGKELIARALHENSSRASKPFIRVNCAAIPRDLIESELFGYEKGAFTGAVSSKPGRFELAHDGTLFLDEIGEIPVNMQVKLLRAIQEQEFERVGGIKTISVDVRLVAATNRDLQEEIRQGRFREDLYYRLNVVQVRLPPLRERTSDIPLLVEHFIRHFRGKLKKEIRGTTDAALERLLAHPWPGNIRELENVIERCTLFCDHERIDVGDLPPELRAASGAPTHGGSESRGSSPGTTAASDAVDSPGSTYPTTMPPGNSHPAHAHGGGGLKEAVREATSRIEREIIVRALSQTGGNVTHTARLLKISRKSLQTKMKELGLREEG
jgi:nitrogen regulation protein NR(I)